MTGSVHAVVRQMKPSPEQLPAIVARGHDIVVSAGAGTGKTSTLTARYLSLLADGLSLRSIVAVTFTNRAALEMRNRIRVEIARFRDGEGRDPEDRSTWDTLYRDLDAARIGTIHSLCAEILKFHPAEAGLDPEFAVLDAGLAALARADAVDAALIWASSEPAVEGLFKYFSVRNLVALLGEMLERRLDVEEALAPGPALRILAAVAQIESDLREFVTSDRTLSAIKALGDAMKFAQNDEAARNDVMYSTLTKALPYWASVVAAADDGDWWQAGHSLSDFLENLKQKGANTNWSGHNPKELAKHIRKQARSFLPEWCDPAADKSLLDVLPALRSVFTFACERYEATKTQQRALDFDDLEQGALRLLTDNADVRKYWQGQIDALLVDEFQDTNRRQAEIVELLAAGRGVRFMVGDAKQSIYGFRGADVHVFREVCESNELHSLTVSYRTHAKLIDRLNRLLEPIFKSGGAGSATQVPFTRLSAFRADPRPGMAPPFLEFHLTKGAKASGASDVAAYALAMRLRELNNTGVAWEEMAILCRGSRSLRVYEDALEEAGIPYVTVAGRGFLERPEVRDVLNALAAIADPSDNLALMGLLRSPVIGFDDGELVALHDATPLTDRGRMTSGALWRALAEWPGPRAERAVKLVSRLNAVAGRVPVAELIKRFLDETCYVAALIQAGQSRAARNLTKLVDNALAARSIGVSNYLHDLGSLRAAHVHEGEARADAEGAVQLMSVHAAKGMEFSVVAIGDAASPGNSTPPSLIVDEDLALVLGAGRAGEASGVLYATAKERLQQIEDAEDSRILYVAATRARDLLIVNGAYSGKGGSGWLKKVAIALGIAETLGAATPQPGAPVQVDAGDGVLCTVYSATPGHRLAERSQPRTPKLETAPLPSTDLLEAIASTFGPLEATKSLTERHSIGFLQRTVGRRVGDIVHEAIAAWRFPDTDPQFEKWLHARIQRQGTADGGESSEIERRTTELLRRLAAHPLCAEFAGSAQRLAEIPYVLPEATNLDEGRLGGTIDLLYRLDNGGWSVVEFKTDRLASLAAMKTSVEKEYAQQIREYGRAVEALLGVTPVLTLCFLDVNGQIRLQRVSPEARIRS